MLVCAPRGSGKTNTLMHMIYDLLYFDKVYLYKDKKGDQGERGLPGRAGVKGEKGNGGERGLPGQSGIDGVTLKLTLDQKVKDVLLVQKVIKVTQGQKVKEAKLVPKVNKVQKVTKVKKEIEVNVGFLVELA